MTSSDRDSTPHAHPHPGSARAREALCLGIIGGSGLYDLDGLVNSRSCELETPFGKPSGRFVIGELPRDAGPNLQIVFIARHGDGHRLAPHQINARANIWGLKSLGVTHALGVCAVGSLREHYEPGDFVLVDQFIDRTRRGPQSFFGEGVVAHVQFGEPICPDLRARLKAAIERISPQSPRVHDRACCVVMEGPAFSTRAESELYRQWGGGVIGMTALPEAKLAREAEMGYAMLAMVTDYDCWHSQEGEVSVEAVVAVMRNNVVRAKSVIAELARTLPVTTRELPYPKACANAVISDLSAIDAECARRYDLLIGHYGSDDNSQ